MIFESQDATKITSALADSCISVHDDDEIVHVHGRRCDNADIKAHWRLQSEQFVSGTIS